MESARERQVRKLFTTVEETEWFIASLLLQMRLRERDMGDASAEASPES